MLSGDLQQIGRCGGRRRKGGGFLCDGGNHGPRSKIGLSGNKQSFSGNSRWADPSKC